MELSAAHDDIAAQLVLHAFENYDKTPVCVYNDDLTNLEALQKLAEENSGISHLRLKRDSCGYSPFTIFPFLAFIKSLLTTLVLVLNNVNNNNNNNVSYFLLVEIRVGNLGVMTCKPL